MKKKKNGMEEEYGLSTILFYFFFFKGMEFLDVDRWVYLVIEYICAIYVRTALGSRVSSGSQVERSVGRLGGVLDGLDGR